MALINRMSRLFSADVHAVLDRIEEPDALLRHAIREMEEELGRSELRLRQLEQERDSLAARRLQVQGLVAELGSQLDVCFANANDELARKVLKRRLETERLEKHVAERHASVATELAKLATTVTEQSEQLDLLRQKAELLATAPHAADERGALDLRVGDDEVEVAFLRERQRRQPS
jgi:phage shock protein A